MKYSFAIETHKGSRGEDRASFFPTKNGFVAVVADGAGGTGNGGIAATYLCELTQQAAAAEQHSWATFLAEADLALMRDCAGGLTTAVIVEAANGYLSGASVGDSGAILLSRGETTDLTAAQNPKPLIGSGRAMPVSFGSVHFDGRLLIASDGILKYAPFSKIAQIVFEKTLQSAAVDLIDAARLPSGVFHDDVAVLLSEAADDVTS